MIVGIIVGAAIVFVFVGMISTKRRLTAMDENIRSAMNQIGVQLSCRFDVLLSLIELTKEYAAQKSQTLTETVQAHRSTVTADSAPNDVLRQEAIIFQAMGDISSIAEQYPQLKEDENYRKFTGAVNSYEKILRTSRLIYNDSAEKLNRALSVFPTSVLGGMLGFHRRGYLPATEEK